MDIYLFGSPDDESVFTFQQKYSYRHDNTPVPGSIPFAIVLDGNYFTAAIHPQKGRFVKLYCVANQSRLQQPNGDPAILTTEVTTETDFMDYTTTSILSDSLFAQLPMSGVSSRIIDLTDAKATSREVVNITLKRLVARFDVKNNWAESRFTLDSIGMDNGRPVATFFSVSGAGDVVSYPFQPFVGENLNRGITPRAFFCYPSPEADLGCLILKGRYLYSYGHEEPVSFRVRFKQNASDQAGGYINIEPNHRYMLEISPDGDSSNLRFLIKDWGEGEMDDYYPDNNIQYLHVEDTTEMNLYDPVTRTIEMAQGGNTESSFLIATKTQTGTRMFVDFNEGKPWFTASTYTPSALDTCIFTYVKGTVPTTNATIIIKNLAGGPDSLINVVPYRGRIPELRDTIDNRSSIVDLANERITLYTKNKMRFTIKAISKSGSHILPVGSGLPFNMSLDSVRSPLYATQTRHTFSLSETDADVTPGTAQFRVVDRRDWSKSILITVEMKEMPYYYNGEPAHYLGGIWWTPVSFGPTNWSGFSCSGGWTYPTYYDYAALLRSENFRDWRPLGWYWTTTWYGTTGLYLAYFYASSITLPTGSGNWGNTATKYNYRCIRK